MAIREKKKNMKIVLIKIQLYSVRLTDWKFVTLKIMVPYMNMFHTNHFRSTKVHTIINDCPGLEINENAERREDKTPL